MQSYQEAKRILKNDYKDSSFCTVVAIATAFDWSAGKAHRLLAKHGRKNGRGPAAGVFTDVVQIAAKKAGKSVEFTKAYDGMTIGRFARERRTGTYIVLVKGHALTVVDGEIMDWTADTAGRRKIGYRTYYWDAQEYTGLGGVAKII